MVEIIFENSARQKATDDLIRYAEDKLTGDKKLYVSESFSKDEDGSLVGALLAKITPDGKSLNFGNFWDEGHLVCVNYPLDKKGA